MAKTKKALKYPVKTLVVAAVSQLTKASRERLASEITDVKVIIPIYTADNVNDYLC